MTKPSAVDPRLAAKFMSNARRAFEIGEPDGSRFEQIVTALLAQRTDWLPDACENLEDAFRQLAAHSEVWSQTMTGVRRMNWRKSAEMSVEHF